MADDLSNFIESQKRKLEQERADLLRGADIEDRSRTSPRGYKPDARHSRGGPTPGLETKAKPAPEENNDAGGLNLGGYEKVQQKLRQERQDEYRKYLAEKNYRTTGRADPSSTDGGRSPHPGTKPPVGPSRNEPRKDNNEDYQEPSRNRRRGKENYDDSPRGYDYNDRRGNQRPENLFESYEDILQKKRAQERRYRGFDEPDTAMERPMRLNAPQYKQNSRSDGYLSRRFDDEDDEQGYSRSRSRGRRERSFESKRVRFQGDDSVDDDTWVKPRKRLDYYDDEDEDDEELLEWLQKRGKRPQRRNSAHVPERQPSKDESLQRSNTDSNIRSQSAPLEGTGIIGGHVESKSDRVKKQEQYKQELQNQMQEQADLKKREKMQRFGVQQGEPQDTQLDRTPRSSNRGSQPPPQSQGYGIPLNNPGPSSRPPPHPAVYPNPYDDPYYYYGNLEMGGTEVPSMGAPLGAPSMNAPRGTAQSNMAGTRGDTRMSGGYTTPGPAPIPQQGGGDVSPRSGLQPPGGYSSIGALGTDQDAPADKKRAAQQAYQEELKKQMQERNLKKQKEKQDKERYDRKIEAEIANYNPWGKGGGGAPLRDSGGQLVANLRTLKQYNDDGVKVSPRDEPPPPELRFQTTLEAELSPRQGTSALSGAIQDLSGSAGRPGFGRSDPLKEPQPQEDAKKAAKQEYQDYLRKQVEEKEKKKREELDRQKKEEEMLEKRITEERVKQQQDFEREQEENRKKEEQARLKNEQIAEAQEAKKKEAENKRREMEDHRQTELKRKLDAELAAKNTSAAGVSQARSSSPPLPAVRKRMEEAGQDMSEFRSSSPPIPTLANQHNLQQRPAVTPPEPVRTLHSRPEPEPARNAGRVDHDVLSQLTTLRQQLKNEEKKVQQQIDHTTAVTKYSKMQRAPEDLGSRRGRRDVDVFERALTNKNSAAKSDSEGFSAADEFNRIKNEDTSSLAGEFRSKFPDPVSTTSVLDLQQQAFLTEQEDKLASLRSDINRPNKRQGKGAQPYQLSRRPVSRDSLLESESQFLVVDDPKEMLPVEQMQSRPRQSSARERRRWKQLEEMARNPKSYDTYKPPTPGGFSLNSVTSFNVDEVAAQNEERLKRLEMIQRGGGQGEARSTQGNPDQVLQRFIDERRHPPSLASRMSDNPLDAETSYEPI